jgi:O-antigen/teichoic acid export membrane protein
MSIWETLRGRNPVRMPNRGKLSGRAAGATLWSMGELTTSYVLRLGSNLVMTRLLLPEAFGLMAMVTTVHIALALLSDIGIEQSVIRSAQGDDPRFLRVAWTIQILRTNVIALAVVGVAALLWVLAPGFAPAGTVYADPQLPGLIAVSAAVMILAGLESTNKYLAARHMQMKWLAILNISGQVVTLVAMVGISLYHPSVWGLLLGMITGSVYRMVMSHVLFAGPRMGLAWDRTIADEFWHFGKWIIGSSMMTFVTGNADRIFLGAVLDKEHFGFYVIAVMWAQAGASVIHKIAGQIGLPLLSGVSRERPHDLLRVFYRFNRINGALCVVGFLAMFLGGAALIDLLYPASYTQSASFMPFLALIMLREWFTPLGTLLLSQGNSKATALASVIEAATTCVALWLGVRLMGIEGGLLAVALSPLGGVVPMMVIARRTIGLDIRRSLLVLAAILAVAVAVGTFLSPQS